MTTPTPRTENDTIRRLAHHGLRISQIMAATGLSYERVYVVLKRSS